MYLLQNRGHFFPGGKSNSIDCDFEGEDKINLSGIEVTLLLYNLIPVIKNKTRTVIKKPSHLTPKLPF